MKKLICLVTIWGYLCIPSAPFAETFQFVECSYTYYTHLHGSSELPIVTNYKQRGVIRGKSENDFLDRATYIMEGMLTRPPSDGIYLTFPEGQDKYAIVIVDKDGDMILGYEYGDITRHYLGTGPSLSGEFTDGTGKFKGIKGTFTLSKTFGEQVRLKSELKKHLAELEPFGPIGWNDHEMCNVVSGQYELVSK